jgi:hypothetical protein
MRVPSERLPRRSLGVECAWPMGRVTMLRCRSKWRLSRRRTSSVASMELDPRQQGWQINACVAYLILPGFTSSEKLA